jgi:hypothetical protein
MIGDEQRVRAEQIAGSLWQGDLLATTIAVVLEAPASSLVDGADELAPIDEHGIWAPAGLEIASGWTAIVTQTCDVIRAIDTHVHLQLMPLVALSEAEWKGALNGRRGTQFSLPPAEGLGIEFPAIDCAISFPVAKAALAHDDVRTLPSPLDPATRVLLSHWLMRRVGRHAFPDELEHYVLGPLRSKVSKSIGKTSHGGVVASCLIGVWSSTEWAPSTSIIFVVDANRLRNTADLDKAVDELLAPVRKALAGDNVSVQITGTVRSLERVSAFDLLVAHRQIDLDALPVGDFAARATITALSAATSSSEAAT